MGNLEEQEVPPYTTNPAGISSGCKVLLFLALLPLIVLLTLLLVRHRSDGTHPIYTVLNRETGPSAKCSLDLQINSAIAEPELTHLAETIRAAECPHSQPVFMFYYLPEKTLGTAPWATTHFNPQLEVNIAGFTPAELTATLAATPTGPNVIGRWHYRGPLPRIVTIFREGSVVLVESHFKGGDVLRQEVTPRGENRYEVNGSSTGDYYRIVSSGELRVCDTKGLIATAAPI